MKPATEALARHIATESLLDHFLLVGGTALSIYLDHRLSEDLDFATTDQSLPEKAISTLLERLTNQGCAIEDATPVAARQDAINDGYDIEAYYQNWLVDGVKLTFFTLEKKNGRKKLANDPGVPWDQNLRLASLDTLFVTKSLVLVDRHALRDNFDMYTLLASKQFSYADLVRAYKTYRPGASLEIPKQRLLDTDYPLTDPGLSGLVDEPEADIINRIYHYFSTVV